MSFASKLTAASNTSTSTLAATPMTLAVTNEEIAAYSGEEWIKIIDDTYLWYDDFDDDYVSTVDIQKNIILDKNQVNLTQEERSQYVPFEMPRRYDKFDLALNTHIQFHYVSPACEDYVNAVNVKYTDTKLRFALLVPPEMTAAEGTVEFEIIATGKNSKGQAYTWKSKTNKDLKVLKSLSGNGIVNPTGTGWYTDFVISMDEKIAKAQAAVEEAKSYAEDAATSAASVDDKISNSAASVKEEVFNQIGEDYYTKSETETEIGNAITLALTDTEESTGVITAKINEKIAAELLNYYTQEEVNTLIANIDISGQLEGLTTRVDGLEEKIDSLDGLANLRIELNETADMLSFFNGENLLKEVALDPTVDAKISSALEPISADLQNIHENIDNLPTTLESDYYNKIQSDELLKDKASTEQVTNLSNELATTKTNVETNKTNIETLGTKVGELEKTVGGLNQSQQYTYDATYDEENTYKLWEIENEGLDTEVRTVKSQFKIQGGSGGSGTTSTLKIAYVTKTPLVITIDDKAEIVYEFSGTDSSGDAVLEGTATWKVNGTVVATTTAVAGQNTFDVTDYLTVGTQKVVLSITDEAGSLVTKTWSVQKIDVHIETTFNDTFTYPIGTVSFNYTPYGAISKDIHFLLDGKEIDTVTTSSSGVPTSYTIPAQTHGAHLFEVYMTAEVNGNTITSNHIVKDVLFYDSSSAIPVIGCIYQTITATQYATTNIAYTVYDPTTENPEVTLAVDGNVVSTLTLDSNTQTWAFRNDEIGDHVLTITCGETVKTINVTITKLDINVTPVTAGLVFDFNPVGKSNNDSDKLWSYSGTNGDYSMTVSDNFDWVNGGYQIDENGEQYFCIKAGTSAEINYQMFADDAKKTGKEMKLVFKTTNVAVENAKFLSCVDSTTGSNNIGLEMFARKACIYGGVAEFLTLPCVPNKVIELEFNISNNLEAITEICGYEHGVSSNHLVYDESYNFTQTNPKYISLGSDDCDFHIYRFKVYNTSLTAKNVLNNFIADARGADEMLDRYNRNQIYDENNALVAEHLADVCKNLKIIKVEAPYFTNKKSDKVPNTNFTFIHKGGDPVLDNWKATDSIHSGQGTSSDNYGGAARNLDIILKANSDFGNSPVITLGDGSVVDKISLTRNSVPVNYLNAKVNVASSNMSTNAIMAKRYNKFNPYKRPFVREDESEIAKIKDTMDFYNGVIFIRETDPDINTHREFADTDWHFYSLCNIGDSKKTDKTRLTDPDDRYECIVEIMDVELPLSDFPSGDEAIATLEADNFDEKGTYGWRYIWGNGTDEENAEVAAYCKQKWIDFYKFVVNSTDEEFIAHLGDYMVVDSAIYYYLFTTRYTLVDNRAKNSFWHYGWTGEYDEDGNKIRKWDLSFAYDMDTALGLNNYGDLVYRYGYEDTDVMDGTTEEVFRESDSTFFCRVRDLFVDRQKEMYNTLESQGAWSSVTLLKEIDDWQSQFPEALWLEHIQKLYIDSYTSTFINGAGDPQFLRDMAHGKCKYPIIDFETNQERYMASKYQSTLAASDHMVMRCTAPTGDLVVEPNYKLKLTPYGHMYLNVKYGTQDPIQVKGTPGQEIEIPFVGDVADIIDIYSISSIQSVGDLSSCYPATLTVSSDYDLKIKELLVGNELDGYDNPNFSTLSLGTMNLLEILNIANLSGLVQSQDLSSLFKLRELYAQGSNIGGVTFASGGEIQIAELPAINSIALRNLLYLTDLNITSLDNLTTITIENCSTVDVKSLVEQAPNLNRIRITGIDWTLEDTDLLDRLYAMSGIDKNGYNTNQSVLAGKIHVPVIRQKLLADYRAAWSDLEITYETMIEQFTVTFVNADADFTVLETQYVDKGENAIDPTTRENNPLSPMLPSTISHDFTFSGWDKSLNEVFGDRTITAVYTESLRKYQIKYVSKGTVMPGYPKEGYYGDNIVYSGNIPTYTSGESGYQYNLFNRWDKSGFLTGDFDENGVKTVNAIYDTFTYSEGAFDNKELSDLSPVQIYAMNKLGLYQNVITDKDEYSFAIGHDIDYDDIESCVIVSEKMTFNGSNYYDTGIQLFDEDRDFVLAIDYKFTADTMSSVLAQCYQGSGTVGFKLMYNNGVQLRWGSNAADITNINSREMIVLRHKKGDSNLYIYNSNLTGNDVEIVSLSSKEFDITSTLVFGCEKQTSTIFANYASGDIYWSKLWYADLGEDVCKQLATWTHDTLNFEACGFNRYFLSDNPDDMCSFSLLATNLLDRTQSWNSSSNTTEGWAGAYLNKYLNSRLYNAMPIQIKSLLKKVQIKSGIGGQSTDTTSSDCYIAIPSVREVNSTNTSAPYFDEGTPIITISDVDSRKRTNSDGTINEYWLRSPSSGYTSYAWYVDKDGELHSIKSVTDKIGVLILISF